MELGTISTQKRTLLRFIRRQSPDVMLEQALATIESIDHVLIRCNECLMVAQQLPDGHPTRAQLIDQALELATSGRIDLEQGLQMVAAAFPTPRVVDRIIDILEAIDNPITRYLRYRPLATTILRAGGNADELLDRLWRHRCENGTEGPGGFKAYFIVSALIDAGKFEEARVWMEKIDNPPSRVSLERALDKAEQNWSGPPTPRRLTSMHRLFASSEGVIPALDSFDVW